MQMPVMALTLDLNQRYCQLGYSRVSFSPGSQSYGKVHSNMRTGIKSYNLKVTTAILHIN